jgi:putative protein-disulfide isomerase
MKRIYLLLLFPIFISGSCEAQQKNEHMTEKTNPLICDPEKGLCEIPGASGQASLNDNRVRLIYFTDPICSACWSIEPQLRKLLLEYAGSIELEYHMGGLLPSWEVYNAGGISKPADVAHHWEEMSRYFEMPIDGDVWLEDPLSSSYPPCIAVKAAEIQGPVKAANFLRRVREMVFLEKKNITRWEHLKQAAWETGLDTAQLVADYNGKAQQMFRDDLALAGQLGVRGFPALFFRDCMNNQTTVYGFRPYAELEQALLKLVPNAKKNAYRTANGHVFLHFPTLTTKEFMVLAGMDAATAENELTALEKAGRVERKPGKNGVLWKRKSGVR